MSRRPAVLGIPCPWSGDEQDPITWRYRLWFSAYRTVRSIEHAAGGHDWRERPPIDGSLWSRHCDWCGATRNGKPR